MGSRGTSRWPWPPTASAAPADAVPRRRRQPSDRPHSDRVQSLRNLGPFGEHDAVQVGQHRPLCGIGLRARGDRKDSGGFGVVDLLQAVVLLIGDRFDVLLDMRVRTLVDQRYLGGVADQGELGLLSDGDIHEAIPFYTEAEPQRGLRAERTPTAPHLRRAGAVHCTERPPEGLGRAVTRSSGTSSISRAAVGSVPEYGPESPVTHHPTDSPHVPLQPTPPASPTRLLLLHADPNC